MARITEIKHQEISELLRWSPLVLAFCLLFVLIVANIIERWALKFIYPKTFQRLRDLVLVKNDDRAFKGFVYHHTALFFKLSILLPTLYPAYCFYLGPDDLNDPLVPGSSVIKGDFVVAVLHLYSSYYMWELCFRGKQASWINLTHHFGLILIAQSALARCALWKEHADANIELYMCLMWGFFDLMFEFPSSVAMIIYRVKPTRHRTVSRIFLAAMAWFSVGIVLDVVVTTTFMSQSWHLWDKVWRYAIPVVFAGWALAQVNGSLQIFQIAMEARKRWLKPENENGESGTSSQESDSGGAKDAQQRETQPKD